MANQEFNTDGIKNLILAQAQGQTIRAVIDEDRKTSEEDLRKDQVWAASARMLYEANNGRAFEGEDEDAAQYGLDEMSSFNTTFFNADMPWSDEDSKGMAEYLSSFNDWSDAQKLSFGYLMEMYESKGVSWAGVGRGLRSMLQDPTNVLSFGGPLAIMGKWSGRQAAKQGTRLFIREHLQNILSKRGLLTVGVASADGATVMQQDDRIRQNLENQVAGTPLYAGDYNEDFDLKRNLISAGTGVAFANLLLGGAKGLQLGYRATRSTLGDINLKQPLFDLSKVDAPGSTRIGTEDTVKKNLVQQLIDRYPQAESVVPYMSDREIQVLNRENMTQRFNTVNKLIEKYEKMDLVEEMGTIALAGASKRGWYKESGELLGEVFGDDFPRFAALLGATSPQLAVRGNLINALNIWRNWDAAGRPTDPAEIKRIMGESVQGEKGEGSVLNAWFDNTVTALTEGEDQLLLSGGKVDSFMRNIMGDPDAVTLDTWMAHYFGTKQSLFGGAGTSPDFPGDPGFTAEYQAVSAITRKAAEALSERTGDEWTPAEIQETVWSFVKSVIEMRRRGDQRSIDEIIKSGDVTAEVVRGADDFATLMADDDVGGILKGTDYGGRLEGALGQRSGATSGEQGVQTQGFIGGTSEESRHLEQLGIRLERGHQQRASTAVIGDIRKSLDLEAEPRVGFDQDRGTQSPRSRGANAHTGTFTSTGRTHRSNNLGNLSYRVFNLAADHAAKLKNIGISTPPIVELEPSPDAGKLFLEKITTAKNSGNYGAAVYLYSAEEYANMRLFTTKDGNAGFAIKGDDIVSVFNFPESKHKRVTAEMLLLAVELGARRLDAFDTVLPTIYSQNGFRVVARVKWVDEFAPDNWDKTTFSPWNKGEPDVVYMIYDPDYVPTKETLKYKKSHGTIVDNPDEAVALQDAELAKIFGNN